MLYLSGLEPFASSVQSQTYEIHELGHVFGFFNVAHFYYYENTASTADFMSTSLLEGGFMEVLREYPLLAGTLQKSKRGRYKVVVDKDNLNLPEFMETQRDVPFSELKAANYASSALLGNVATMGRYTDNCPKAPAKLARVHIVRCKDNSGVVIFLGISHTLVDGFTYNLLMRQWAEACKRLATKGSLDAKPARPLSYGSELMDSYMQQVAPPAGAFIRHQFIPGGLISKTLARRSMNTQAKLLRKFGGVTNLTSHLYFVSQGTIDEMRGEIKEVLPADQPVSSNDVLAALINVAMAQSLDCAAPGDTPSGVLQKIRATLFGSQKSQPKEFVHIGVADIRPRLKIPAAADYCGSAVVIYMSHIPFDALQGPVTPRMLALAANAARRGTNGVDKGYIHTYSSAIAENPDSALRPFVYCCKPPAHLAITNHSRIDHYSIDFGWGVPAWAHVIEDTINSLCYICPAPPTRKGVVVHMMLPEDTQDRMRQHPFWKEKTEFIR